LRIWIDVLDGLLTLGRGYSLVDTTYSKRTGVTSVPLELGLMTITTER